MRRYEVKIADRIGERGEPWGVPSGTGKGSMVVESRRMDAVRLVRKEKIQFTKLGGKPFLLEDIACSVGVDMIEEAGYVKENEGSVMSRSSRRLNSVDKG